MKKSVDKIKISTLGFFRSIGKGILFCLKKIVSFFPIVSGLLQGKPQVFKDVASELGFVWLLSLTPVLLSSLISTAQAEEGGYFHFLFKNLKSGEIFIYTNALLAPVGYMMFRLQRDQKKCPNFISIMLFMILILLASTAIYVVQKAEQIRNYSFVGNLAIGLFVVAAMVRFSTMVYSKLNIDFASSAREQEEDFTKEAEAVFEKP